VSVQLQSSLSVAGAALLSIHGVPSTPRALLLCHGGGTAEVGADGSVELSLPGACLGQSCCEMGVCPQSCMLPGVGVKKELCSAAQGCLVWSRSWFVSGDGDGWVCAPCLRVLSPRHGRINISLPTALLLQSLTFCGV